MMSERDDDLAKRFQRELLGSLSSEGMPAPPSRLLDRIMARVAVEASPRMLTVRAADGRWAPIAKGVFARELNDDGKVRTWLARLEAGASLPAHSHDDDEECLVVEGSVLLDGELLQAGDYQLAPRGTRHERVTSPQGCVLLVRSRSPVGA